MSPSMENAIDASASSPGPRVIPSRAIVLAVLIAAFFAVVSPYLDFARRTWYVGYGSLLNSALVVLAALVVLNGALARSSLVRPFSRGELLAMYGVLISTVSVVATSCVPYIIANTAYPFYMATPGNGWEGTIWPYLPLWLRPSDLRAAAWIYEGAPRGSGVLWADWTAPMLGWSAFAFALFAATFCLSALFRKDWIERQRLAFPLVEVPLAMVGEEPVPVLRTSILNSRIFWAGFAGPAIVGILGWLHNLYPTVPTIDLYQVPIGTYFAGMPLPWSVLGDLRLSLYFPVVGITCLIPTDISLSLWSFYALFRLQQLLWASFGVTGQGGAGAIAVSPETFISFEEAGGFLAVGALLLYQSRKTIVRACLSLLGHGRDDRDPYAPIADRWALLGFVAANALMVYWAVSAGMSWWSFLVLMGLFYALVIGVSRAVAAGGVFFAGPGVFPPSVMLRIIGAVPIGPRSLTITTVIAYIFMRDLNNLPATDFADSFKLLHKSGLRARPFTIGVAVALPAVIVLGIAATLRMLHQYGANTLAQYPFASWPMDAFGALDASLRNPEQPNNWLRVAIVSGGAIAALVSWLHSRFLWWPVSPIGFLLASSWGMNWMTWPGVFVGWVIAVLVRRYGGLRLLHTLRPAFIGLILGDFLTGGVLAVLSTILGIQGGQT